MLLELEQHDELDKLFDQFDQDAMAEWAYSRALLAFRLEGDSERARHLLTQAQQGNAHAPAYLTGDRPLPHDLPGYFAYGGDDEAVLYAAEYLPAWRNTSGAISWLRKTLKVSPAASAPQRRRPKWRQLKAALLQLPQCEDEVWEIDLRAVDAPSLVDNAADKPWTLMIANASEGTMLAFVPFVGRPKDAEIWDELLEAMQHPPDDQPHRPAEIRVARKTWHKAWSARLGQLDVGCRLSEALKHIEDLLAQVPPPAEMLQRLAADASSAGDGPDIEELPLHAGEIWQAGVRRLPTWVEVDGQPQRPWMVLVADVASEFVLVTEILDTRPDPEQFWQLIRKAICAPGVGEPHLPGVVEVAEEDDRQYLAAKLEPCGVRCVASDGLQVVDTLASELVEHLADPNQLQPLIHSPGMTPVQLGSFFVAAAEFYRNAPWRRISADSVIQIDCDHYSSGRWYAAVMGQSGQQLGVAFYEDLDLISGLIAGTLSDEEAARRTSCISMTYGEVFDMSPLDFDAAEEHSWPVAGPEAYPAVVRVNPGLALRTPLKWELELVEGCLRAIPDFIRRDVAGSALEVVTATGKLNLRLELLNDN